MEEKSKKSFGQLVKIALTREADPSKADLLNILFFVRQVFGFAFGLVAG